MRGIPVPERTEDFTADPVELFFDLAYVFAFSQLVGLLIEDHSWAAVGKIALLFGLLWLPWQQLTWSANAVSGNGRPVRIIFLIATVVSVPMAASVTTAYESGGVAFAIALSIIMVLGFTIQNLSTERGSEYRRAVWLWMTPNLVAIVLLLIGSFGDGSTRVVIWLIAAGVVFVAMLLAGRGEWLVRSGHMAERHGLVIIIALGEVIVAIGLPVVAALQDGEGVSTATIVALAASGLFAGLLWWAYFDRISPALEHGSTLIESDKARGRYTRDVYTWAHAPVVAGVILSAAALEEIALHPLDPVNGAFRLMLVGGLVLVLFGIASAIWRAFKKVAAERVVGALAIAVVVASGASLSGMILLLIVVAIMVVTLVVEHFRVETVIASTAG
jgi:low temperature requirement protein LtrA